MKRKFILILSCFLTIAILLNGCGSKRQSETIPDNLPQNSQKEHLNATEGSKQIRIESDTHKMIFQLNGSSAAKALYEQLPLAVTIEDYGTVEKIFYPPQKLDISDTPPAEGPAGTLAYYEPWGDVAIFTDKCEKTNGLYELGEAISGMEQIKSLSGEIRIEKNEESEAENSMPESGSSAQPETHPSSEGSQASLSSQTEDSTMEPQKGTDEGTSSKSSVLESGSSSQPQSSSSSESLQTSYSSQPLVQNPIEEISGGEDNAVIKIKIQVGNSFFTATMENNAAAEAFMRMMEPGPVVIQMEDYSGFEKVGSLGESLPASNSQITAQAGDIMLYNGNQIVIFYGSNSWEYTRLGKIDNLSGWEEALGSGDVTVTFSLDEE